MNLVQLAPTWLISIFYLLLLLAAVEDGWRMRISNSFPILLIIGAVVAAILIGPNRFLWHNLTLFALLLALGTFLFGRGLLGGGDVKLLASCGLWFDLPSGWKMLLAVAIAGGILALALILLRLAIGSSDARWMLLRPRGGIPYGIAIALGAAALTAALR